MLNMTDAEINALVGVLAVADSFETRLKLADALLTELGAVQSAFVVNLIAQAEATDVLLHWLETEDTRFPNKERLFQKLGRDTIPPEILLKYLRHENAGVYAVAWLPHVTDMPSVLAPLLDAYEHQPRVNTREGILRKLLAWQNAELPLDPTPYLVRWLGTEQNERTRDEIIRVLSVFGDASHLPLVLAEIDARGYSIPAILALGRFGDPSVIPRLQALVNEQPNGFGFQAMIALSHFGGEVGLGAVRLYLFREEAIIAVAGALERIGVPALDDLLMSYYHFWEVPTALQHIIPALAKVGGAAVADHLLPVLHTDYRYARGLVVRALGDIGNPGVVPELIRLLGDDTGWTWDREHKRDITISETAAESLRKIGTPEALTALRNWKKR